MKNKLAAILVAIGFMLGIGAVGGHYAEGGTLTTVQVVLLAIIGIILALVGSYIGDTDKYEEE
jgi:hypothetical protein